MLTELNDISVCAGLTGEKATLSNQKKGKKDVVGKN